VRALALVGYGGMGLIILPLLALHALVYVLVPSLVWWRICRKYPASGTVSRGKSVLVVLGSAVAFFAACNGPQLLWHTTRNKVYPPSVLMEAAFNPLPFLAGAFLMLGMGLAARSEEPLHRLAMHGVVLALAAQPCWPWLELYLLRQLSVKTYT
jgi:hypothetical protein